MYFSIHICRLIYYARSIYGKEKGWFKRISESHEYNLFAIKVKYAQQFSNSKEHLIQHRMIRNQPTNVYILYNSFMILLLYLCQYERTKTVRQVCISISTARNEVGAGNKRLPHALRQGYTR